MAQLTLADEQLTDLSHDELALILFHLPLAHDIALAGLTCRALCDAAKLALKLRPFSGEVVALALDGDGSVASASAVVSASETLRCIAYYSPGGRRRRRSR